MKPGAAAARTDPDLGTLPVWPAAPKTEAVEVVPTGAKTTTPTASAFLSARKASPTSSSGTALEALALTAAVSATGPEDYLQKFRDADPTDQFLTPASPEHADLPENTRINNLTMGEAAALYGTNGFSHRTDGSLQYTNGTGKKVAVLYGPALDDHPFDVVASGIVVVNPGQTTVLPGGSTTVGVAQTPKTHTPLGDKVNIVGVGGPGYPAGGSTGVFKTYPSTNSFINNFNSVINSGTYSQWMRLAGDISSVLGIKAVSTVVNFISSAVTGYKGDVFGLAMSGVQGVGDWLMGLGVKSKVGFLYAAGAAVSTIGYVAELAHDADWRDPGSTVRYAVAHPLETVQEFGKATQQVLTHVGATVIGSLGGFLGFGR